MTNLPDAEDRHTLGLLVDPQSTVLWLARHGYRCAPALQPFMQGGVVYARPNQPAQLAVFGDTLVWDGASVMVEEA